MKITLRELSSKIEETEGTQIIDGTGKALMPAGIEIHTEFSSLNPVDDFEIGSKAALAGGTATVLCIFLRLLIKFFDANFILKIENVDVFIYSMYSINDSMYKIHFTSINYLF